MKIKHVSNTKFILLIAILLFSLIFSNKNNFPVERRNLATTYPTVIPDSTHIKSAYSLPFSVTGADSAKQSTSIFLYGNSNFILPTYGPSPQYHYMITNCFLPNITCNNYNTFILTNKENMYVNTVDFGNYSIGVFLADQTNQLNLSYYRISLNTSTGVFNTTSFNMNMPGNIPRYVLLVDQVIILLNQNKTSKTAFTLVNFIHNNKTYSTTSIRITNHNLLADYKLFRLNNSIIFFMFYDNSNGFGFFFYNINENTYFTKYINRNLRQLVSFNYEYQLINGESIVTIVYTTSVGMTLTKFRITGTLSNDIAVYFTSNTNDYNSLSNVNFIQHLKWAGNWVIINLCSIANTCSLYSFIYTRFDASDGYGFYKTKTTINQSNGILDILLYEQNSDREAKPIAIHSDYISGTPPNKKSSIVFIKNSNFNGGTYTFFNNSASSNFNAYQCRKNEYFSSDNNFTCTSCTSGFVKNNICVETGCTNIQKANQLGYCPDSDNNYIDYSLQISRSSYNNSAVSCSIGSGSVNNSCVNCLSISNNLFINKCESSCPPGFIKDINNICQINDCGPSYILNPIKNICVPCGNMLKFNLYSESCVSECVSGTSINGIYCGCSSGYTLTFDYPYAQCLLGNCKYASTTLFTSGYSFCANSNNTNIAIGNSCSQGYVYNSLKNRCLKCTDPKLSYFYNGSCLAHCPINTIANSYYFECYSCGTTQYAYNNSCVDSCPLKTITLSSQKLCLDSCDSADTLCVVQCPLSNFYYSTTYNTCNECPSSTPLRYYYRCVASCPIKTQQIDKKCVDCTADEIFLADNFTCISKCPDNYKYDSTNRICSNCLSSGQYYNFEIGQCATYCPTNYMSHSKLGCFSKIYVVYEDKLYTKCPTGYQPAWNNVCYPCFGYVDEQNNTCSTTKCKDGYYPNSVQVCKTCSEMKLINALEGGCVFTCDYKTQYLDELNNKCILKNKNKPDDVLYAFDLPCELNCLNSGVCFSKKLLSNTYSFCNLCRCANGYFGRLCEYNIKIKSEFEIRLKKYISSLPTLDDLDNPRSNFNIYGPSTNDYYNVNEILRIIVTMPELLITSLSYLFSKMASQTKLYYTNKNMFNRQVFNLLSASAMLLKIQECQDKTNDSFLIENIRNSDTQIADLVESNVDLMLLASNINLAIYIENQRLQSGLESVNLVQTESFNVFITENTNQEYSETIIKRKPLFDFQNCIKLLKQNNLIPWGKTLYSITTTFDYSNEGSVFNLTSVKAINYASNSTSSSNSTIYSNSADKTNSTVASNSSINNITEIKGYNNVMINSIFGSGKTKLINQDGSKVDTSICFNVPVKLPINHKVVNLTDFFMINQLTGEDIYNKNSAFFNNVCVPYSNSILEADMTLNERKRVYNVLIGCSAENCNYTGIDISNLYTICTCNITPADSFTNFFGRSIFNKSGEVTQDVIGCFRVAFDNKLYGNISFYFSSVVYLSGLVLSFVAAYLFSLKVLLSNISSVVATDACFLIIPGEKPQFVGISNNKEKSKKELNQVNDQEEIKEDSLRPKEIKTEQKEIVEDEQENNEENPNEIEIDNKLTLNKPKVKIQHLEQIENKNEKKPVDNNLSIVNISGDINFKNDIFQEKYSANKDAIHNNYNDRDLKVIRKHLNGVRSRSISVEYDDTINERRLTYNDLNYLSPEMELERDIRGYWEFLSYHLKEYHILACIFYKKSILSPLFARILKVTCSISIIFLSNALLYTDDLIEKRYTEAQDVSSPGFGYTFVYEFDKCVLAALCSFVLIRLIWLIILVPKSLSMEINILMVKQTREAIEEANALFSRRMKLRFIILALVIIPIKVFSWYYTISFCSSYHYTSYSWMYASFISLFVEWFVLRVGLSLLFSLIRSIAQGCPYRFQLKLYVLMRSVINRII